MEYTGRMVCDGNGNLLADERRLIGFKSVTVTDTDGEPILHADGTHVVVDVPQYKFGKDHERPIAYDEDTDTFVFIEGDEPSHNERFHKQFADVVGTQSVDPELPGYAGTPDNPVEGAEHHFGVLPDDPHYEEGATSPNTGRVTNTRVRQLPDRVAARTGGHTHQHKVGA